MEKGAEAVSKSLQSHLDQLSQLSPGLPEIFNLREDVPLGQTGLEAEGKTGVREISLGGEQELGVRHQEIHLQAGQHLLQRRTLLLV